MKWGTEFQSNSIYFTRLNASCLTQVSDFNLGSVKDKQGSLETRKQSRWLLSTIITANRLKHNSGPVHANSTRYIYIQPLIFPLQIKHSLIVYNCFCQITMEVFNKDSLHKMTLCFIKYSCLSNKWLADAKTTRSNFFGSIHRSWSSKIGPIKVHLIDFDWFKGNLLSKFIGAKTPIKNWQYWH